MALDDVGYVALNRKYAMLAAMLKELPPSIKEPFVRDELDNLLTLEMKGQRDGTDLMPECIPCCRHSEC